MNRTAAALIIDVQLHRILRIEEWDTLCSNRRSIILQALDGLLSLEIGAAVDDGVPIKDLDGSLIVDPLDGLICILCLLLCLDGLKQCM